MSDLADTPNPASHSPPPRALISWSLIGKRLFMTMNLMTFIDEKPRRNPTLEEQALARIHRLGQTREVTTVRFYIRNSFEEVRPNLDSIWNKLADSPTVASDRASG